MLQNFLVIAILLGKSMDHLSLQQSAIALPVTHIPLKRGFDILFAVFALLLTSPLLLLITCIALASLRGNIIYSHERIGRGGVPFRCYKFRTMHKDADKRLKELLASDGRLKEEWEKNYKLKDDPRITRFGALLRKTSLDELPQLWNVFIGDMSVVGPRPVTQEEVDRHFSTKAKKILSVRPGITGLWQVSGRSNIISYAERVKLDEHYVDNRTFLYDMALIIKTFPALIRSRGAY